MLFSLGIRETRLSSRLQEEEVCEDGFNISNSLCSLPLLPYDISTQLAEYRQRKAHADSQKKQKKKKKKKLAEDSDGGQLEAEQERPATGGGEEVPGGDTGDGAQTEGGPQEPPTTQFTFSRTLRSGETVQHNQTYTIEVDATLWQLARRTASLVRSPEIHANGRTSSCLFGPHLVLTLKTLLHFYKKKKKNGGKNGCYGNRQLPLKKLRRP